MPANLDSSVVDVNVLAGVDGFFWFRPAAAPDLCCEFIRSVSFELGYHLGERL